MALVLAFARTKGCLALFVGARCGVPVQHHVDGETTLSYLLVDQGQRVLFGSLCLDDGQLSRNSTSDLWNWLRIQSVNRVFALTLTFEQEECCKG
jgi:hypothetical protein